MDDKKTGGAAFPDPGRAQSAKQRETITETGMTLRDYFAAKALPAAMSIPWRDVGYQPADGLTDMQQHVRLAYQMADAMLVERAK